MLEWGWGSLVCRYLGGADVGGFQQQQFSAGFFPNQEWQQGMVNYPMMMGQMGYPPNPMIDQSGGPHGQKRQRDG